MIVPSAAYKLFRQAILQEKQITCMYDGHYRELCPLVIGYKDKKEKVLAYQFAGNSKSGLPHGGEWRCLYVSRVRAAQTRDGPWHEGNEHTKTQRCVDLVDLDINIHVRRSRRGAR